MLKIVTLSNDLLGRQTWGFRVEEKGEEILIILRDYTTESRKTIRHKFVILGYYGFLCIPSNAHRIQLENIPFDVNTRNAARNLVIARLSVVRMGRN